jgi:hypothetical protein
MPWNGSAPNQTAGRTDGVRTGDTVFAQQAAAPVDIEPTLLDVHATDLKDMINACLKKDGGNTATANIPMGGFGFTNVAEATARTMYARFSQIQDNKGEYVATVGGTADVMTLTPSPAITAYAAGQRFSFIAGGTNTGATTLNVSGVGAIAIRRNDGSATALSAGDIVSGAIVDVEYNGTVFLLLSAQAFLQPLDADLTAIAALSTTGIARRSGSNTWALDAGVTHLAATTANRLFGTDGSGNSGLVTLSGLTLSAASLSVDAASDSAAGKIEIAVQSEMETGSSTTLAVTPGRQHFHPGHPKAWLNFDSTGTVTILGDYGVTSLSDDATGSTTATLDTAFSSTAYAVVGLAEEESNVATVMEKQEAGTHTATTFQTQTVRAGSGDSGVDYAGLAFFGDQ